MLYPNWPRTHSGYLEAAREQCAYIGEIADCFDPASKGDTCWQWWYYLSYLTALRDYTAWLLSVCKADAAIWTDWCSERVDYHAVSKLDIGQQERVGHVQAGAQFSSTLWGLVSILQMQGGGRPTVGFINTLRLLGYRMSDGYREFSLSWNYTFDGFYPSGMVFSEIKRRWLGAGDDVDPSLLETLLDATRAIQADLDRRCDQFWLWCHEPDPAYHNAEFVAGIEVLVRLYEAWRDFFLAWPIETQTYNLVRAKMVEVW